MEFQCRVIVQRRCTSCCSSVENIPLQAERHSAGDKNCSPSHRNRRSPSDRNAVRNHNGIVFGFRAESRSPSTGFPSHPFRTVGSPSFHGGRHSPHSYLLLSRTVPFCFASSMFESDCLKVDRPLHYAAGGSAFTSLGGCGNAGLAISCLKLGRAKISVFFTATGRFVSADCKMA